MRILVVDDERGIRKLISVMLSILGHETVLAENGLEAVRRFSAGAREIDLVITDLVMPVMDGPEAIRQIRKISPNVKVVSMSGYSGSTLPPGTTFLEKPFTLASLRLALSRSVSGGGRLAKAG